MVPEGQPVYIKLDSEHSFTYRAVQEFIPAGASPFYWRLRYAGFIMRASPPSTKLIDIRLERLLFDLSKCLT